MPLPLSLEIVGTDRSHPEAGGGTYHVACRSVANDSPVLGRLFTHLPSDSQASSVVAGLYFSFRNSIPNRPEPRQGPAEGPTRVLHEAGQRNMSRPSP